MSIMEKTLNAAAQFLGKTTLPEPGDFTYKKLVRDKIPEILKEKGLVAETRRLTDDEFEIELMRKLVEEAIELVKAPSMEDRIKELADIQEVIMALKILWKADNKVLEMQCARNSLRGRFSNRIFLEGVGEGAGQP